MKKKDARILWSEEDGKIDDIIVEEFTEENMESKQYLYNKYSFDIGNCLYEFWNKMTLAHVLIKMFITCNFKDDDVKFKFMKELCEIDEWKEELNDIYIKFTVFDDFYNEED